MKVSPRYITRRKKQKTGCCAITSIREQGRRRAYESLLAAVCIDRKKLWRPPEETNDRGAWKG